MTLESSPRSVKSGEPPLIAENVRSGTAILGRFSPQDWLVFGYLLYLNLALLPRYDTPGFGPSLQRMLPLLLFYGVVVGVVRLTSHSDGFLGPLAYRVALQGTVQSSYFFFLTYLPQVNPGNLDPLLYRIDLRLFGFEPALYFDRILTGAAAEWFAFFYFCYFFLLAIHTLPILLFCRNERLLGEFSFGLLTVFCVGHICYTCVPGYGPVKELAADFLHPLPRGFWVDTVLRTVATGGAQKDIFPSIHTAAPTFITLFSFRNRAHLPFKYTWPVMAFFAGNIVIATLYLRWHWLIDVACGLCLAASAFGLSVAVTKRDLSRRLEQKLGPSWPRFTRLPWSKSPFETTTRYSDRTL